MVDVWEVEEGAHLQSALSKWVNRLGPSVLEDARYQAAFIAFDKALIGTIEYMKTRRDGQPEDSARERQLTDLWNKASQAISPLDAELSDACMVKGLGWTDPAVWEAAKNRGLKIGVEDMQNARIVLNKKRQASWQASMTGPEIPAWFPVAGVAFAAVTVLFLMYLILGPNMDAQKKTTFDVLMAFCASASAGFLGGSAVANGSIPLFQNSPIAFSAYGGIGTFIVVFLILHFAG